MAFLIAGQIVGAAILLKGITLLQEHQGNFAALYPYINAFKIPHAISLHAIQALSVIGVLADRSLKSRKIGKWIVILASLTILVALGVSFSRAM